MCYQVPRTVPHLHGASQPFVLRLKRQGLKEQLNVVVHGFGWSKHRTPWSCMKDKSVGSLLDLQTKTEAMIKECGKVDAPPEPLALDSATKAIPSLGTITLLRFEPLNHRHACELRRAKAIEAERAA